MLNKQTVESIKEFLRIALISVLPILILHLENPEMTLNTLVISSAIAFLKALDKYIHVDGKVNDNPDKIKGLTRF